MAKERGTVFKFELSEQMVAAMAQVLRKGPYDVVAPILEELRKQVNAQTPARPPINGAALAPEAVVQ